MSFPVSIPSSHGSLELANPIMIASGTYGLDGYSGLFSMEEVVGGIVLKTVSEEPMRGNPPPIYYPTLDSGENIRTSPFFLNSVGLTNPGIEHLLEWLGEEERYNVPVILSINIQRTGNFFEMLRQIRRGTGFVAVEINLSCPNIYNDVGDDLGRIGDVVNAAVTHLNVPVLVKVAPNVYDFEGVVRTIEGAGADAITICNTMPAMDIDIVNRQFVLGNQYGGMSGPALRPIALNLVHRASKVVQIPIIGVGGISSIEHVIGFLMAGASAVQVGTAQMVEMGLATRLVEELERYGTGWNQIERL